MIIQLLYFIPGIYNGISKIWGYKFFLRKSDVAKLSVYLVVFSFVHFLAWINISINSLGVAFAIYFWVAALIPEAARWGNMIDKLKVGETVKVIYKDGTADLVINLRKTLFELCQNGVWYVNKENRQFKGDCIYKDRIDKVIVTCNGKERYLRYKGGTWKLDHDRNRWRYIV